MIPGLPRSEPLPKLVENFLSSNLDLLRRIKNFQGTINFRTTVLRSEAGKSVGSNSPTFFSLISDSSLFESYGTLSSFLLIINLQG